MDRLHDAMLWEPAGDNFVQCKLCGHRCKIAPGSRGYCMVRENVDGVLKTLSYDKLIATHVDPIEKKPLFHYLPGSESLSIATAGCNFRCKFCQNWQISQCCRLPGIQTPASQSVPPEDIVAAAERLGCKSISYTYTEPTIFFELAYDTAKIAHSRGLGNCFVSNGFMTAEAVDTVAPYLDAINVDLKAFSDDTYREILGGKLQPVLDCLQKLAESDTWLEVTTLVVPGMNDSDEELREIANFIASLGVDVPWHVSRFHGDFEYAASPATPLDTLKRACDFGCDAGLNYIYCGNVPGQVDESTHCPGCGEVVVARTGFFTQRVSLQEGCCPECGQKIAGVWK